MITIICGEDRIAAERYMQELLGGAYELFEGEDITPNDLPSLFLGTSLFAETRSILIKDLQESSGSWTDLTKYLDTPHNIIIWESKLDKRSATYKSIIKDKQFKIIEFKTTEPTDKWLAFNVYDLATSGNSKKAIVELDKSITQQDPYMFLGGLIAASTKAFEKNPTRHTAALKILAKTDIDIKTTGLDPWLLIKSGLLKLS